MFSFSGIADSACQAIVVVALVSVNPATKIQARTKSPPKNQVISAEHLWVWWNVSQLQEHREARLTLASIWKYVKQHLVTVHTSNRIDVKGLLSCLFGTRMHSVNSVLDVHWPYQSNLSVLGGWQGGTERASRFLQSKQAHWTTRGPALVGFVVENSLQAGANVVFLLLENSPSTQASKQTNKQTRSHLKQQPKYCDESHLSCFAFRQTKFYPGLQFAVLVSRVFFSNWEHSKYWYCLRLAGAKSTFWTMSWTYSPWLHCVESRALNSKPWTNHENLQVKKLKSILGEPK